MKKKELLRMEFRLTILLFCSVFFFISVTSEEDNVCSRPEISGNIDLEGLQRFYNPGAELTLSCKQGYTPMFGLRKIVCTSSGQWTKTQFQCTPKLCPLPEPISNGKISIEDNVYRSTINYTCNEGYILIGSTSAVCQANGTWSTLGPKCTPVTCSLAPVPQYGMVIYDKKIRGKTIDYSTTVTYRCRPPYAVFGNSRAECTANGTWTETPECRLIMCPPPEDIERGYRSSDHKKEFDFMETVKYDCYGDFVLEGNLERVCQIDGKWSEKPSCKAPCILSIQRAKILYKGRKMWIEDLDPKKILHKETISVFCKDNAMGCGYPIPTQCIDGELKIPECFEEPSELEYKNNSSSLPSELSPC